MKTVTTSKAKTHFSSLLREVAVGESVVILRGEEPVAKLVPYADPPARPKVGEVMDEPFSVPTEAFQPMTQGEVQGWGLR